jgi:hypothetical protein
MDHFSWPCGPKFIQTQVSGTTLVSIGWLSSGRRMSSLNFEITHEKERMLVDDDHVNYGYRIDYRELTKSAFADGEFYFFTCGCGEPACAGINEPIEVTSDGDKVYWHIIQPEPERWFTFRRAQYVDAIREALTAILRIQTRKKENCRFGPYGFSRGTFEQLYASFSTNIDHRAERK